MTWIGTPVAAMRSRLALCTAMSSTGTYGWPGMEGTFGLLGMNSKACAWSPITSIRFSRLRMLMIFRYSSVASVIPVMATSLSISLVLGKYCFASRKALRIQS